MPLSKLHYPDRSLEANALALTLVRDNPTKAAAVLAASLQACSELVGTIETTGGLIDVMGQEVPAIDEDWSDLGQAAINAHNVLLSAGIIEPLTRARSFPDA